MRGCYLLTTMKKRVPLLSLICLKKNGIKLSTRYVGWHYRLSLYYVYEKNWTGISLSHLKVLRYNILLLLIRANETVLFNLLNVVSFNIGENRPISFIFSVNKHSTPYELDKRTHWFACSHILQSTTASEDLYHGKLWLIW